MSEKNTVEKTEAVLPMITLNKENAANLQWVSDFTGVEPERLVNEWFLCDLLRDARDPVSGFLRDIIESVIYEDAAEGEEVQKHLKDWENAAKAAPVENVDIPADVLQDLRQVEGVEDGAAAVVVKDSVECERVKVSVELMYKLRRVAELKGVDVGLLIEDVLKKRVQEKRAE